MTAAKKTIRHPAHEKSIPPPPPDHRGSRVKSAKFTEDDIKVVRRMHRAGWGIQALATRYGTTWLTMSRIVKRQSWQHVPDDDA